MPNVNPQQKGILPSSLDIAQQPDGNNIVQPVIVLVARLKHSPQLQSASGLSGSRSLQQDIRSVVGAEVVSCVSAEDAGLRVCHAPVCAEVEDLACIGVSVLLLLQLKCSLDLRLQFKGEWGARPRSRGPVKLPPMIGMALRIPRGPWDVYRLS